MKVADLAGILDAAILTGETGLDREVAGVYTCDLLSWVISHAQQGDAWITVHTNLNVIAVALLAEVACVIIPEGIAVEAATLSKAVQEGIPVLTVPFSTYKICCKAYGAGIL